MVLKTGIFTRSIISHYDKCNHLIHRLLKELIAQVILNSPADGKYELIKKLILETVEPTSEATLDKLFKESELGDCKPSTLIKIRGQAGSRVDEYFRKQLWLRCLPPQVRAIVDIQLDMPLY